MANSTIILKGHGHSISYCNLHYQYTLLLYFFLSVIPSYVSDTFLFTVWLNYDLWYVHTYVCGVVPSLHEEYVDLLEGSGLLVDTQQVVASTVI